MASTDGETMKMWIMMLMVVNRGIVNIIIGESEKKERCEEPSSSNREKMGGEINQIIQTMN